MRDEKNKNICVEKMSDIDKLMIKLEDMELNSFYGSFEIKYEKGKIVHCKKIESIKL